MRERESAIPLCGQRFVARLLFSSAPMVKGDEGLAIHNPGVEVSLGAAVCTYS